MTIIGDFPLNKIKTSLDIEFTPPDFKAEICLNYFG